MARHTIQTVWLLGVSVLVLGACSKKSDDRPGRVPVSGTVLYKGQPVENADVIFEPIGRTPAAAGLTNAQGRYQLETYEPGDGAVPGDYKIIVRKVEVTRGSKGEALPDDYVGPPPEEKWLLPVKFGQADTSGLTATVKEGQANDFKFELQD